MSVLSFGEILFDVFPDNRRIIGGAPLNVLIDLSRLGEDGLFMVSSVGNDEDGERALATLEKSNINSDFVSRSKLDTSLSRISLNDRGEASYEFNSPSSMDDISLSDNELDRIGDMHFDAFVYGTLSLRGDRTRDTFNKLYFVINADYFVFDLNFRDGFYSREIISMGLERANVLKLNETELGVLKEVLSLSDDWKESLFSAHSTLSLIALTMGDRGSILYTPLTSYSVGVKDYGCVKDTVGSGDMYTASLIYALKRGVEVAKMAEGASILSSYVASKEGATPLLDESVLRDFYSSFT